MKKKTQRKTLFVCKDCNHEEPKWLGRCPNCGGWNTFFETDVVNSSPVKGNTGSSTGKVGYGGRSQSKKVKPLSSVEVEEAARRESGLAELDRVLGGGLLPGSAILLGGAPGIGKSTLMLQMAGHFSRGGKILYVTGEESDRQIKLRANRLGVNEKGIDLYAGSDIEGILRALDNTKPEVLIIDSIQTMVSIEAGTIPGTPNQLRYCSHELIDWAKEKNGCVFFIAHVTKEGTIAGPKLIEHMVDTVLYFEEADHGIRLLRAQKNRFGSVDEIGLFTMEEKGLNEINDTGSYFLVKRHGPLPAGIAVAPVYEGSRVLMVEIQALTVSAKSGISRTYSDTIDQRRVSRVSAVLEKHTGLSFSDQDIYVNVAGGIRLQEVGIELPLATALYSARTGIAVPENCAVTGELSLAGEVRSVNHLRNRVKTATDMGFKHCIGPVPFRNEDLPTPGWTGHRTIQDVVKAVFGSTSTEKS